MRSENPPVPPTVEVVEDRPVGIAHVSRFREFLAAVVLRLLRTFPWMVQGMVPERETAMRLRSSNDALAAETAYTTRLERQVENLQRELEVAKGEGRRTRRSLVLMRAAVESSPNPRVVAKPQGWIEEINSAARALFGLVEGEESHFSLYTLLEERVVPVDPFARQLSIAKLLIENGSITGLRVYVRSVEGREIPMLLSLSLDKSNENADMRHLSMELTDTSELEDRAERDGLTGLLNKVPFQTRLKRAYNLLVRGSLSHLSLLVVDIDHFKRVNDTYGHAAGDVVLRRVSEVLRRAVREEDILGRFGGEEFVVALHGANDAAVAAVAERMREEIERTAIRLADGTVMRVTASFGHATHARPDEDDAHTLTSSADLFEEADRALYRAKNTGRNRVCRAEVH